MLNWQQFASSVRRLRSPQKLVSSALLDSSAMIAENSVSLAPKRRTRTVRGSALTTSASGEESTLTFSRTLQRKGSSLKFCSNTDKSSFSAMIRKKICNCVSAFSCYELTSRQIRRGEKRSFGAPKKSSRLCVQGKWVENSIPKNWWDQLVSSLGSFPEGL